MAQTIVVPDSATNGNVPKTPSRPTAEPNVLEVVFGNLLIKPWYPSFYPEELAGRTVDRLYVCPWCFKYSKELMGFLGHLKICGGSDQSSSGGNPPGRCIYEKDGYALWEVDGEASKAYAQNLSLFAKLFLDTKSVFYDVTTFFYYVLVAHNPDPAINVSTSATAKPRNQVVGFFSKEKMSWDNNNLACILVFPPWQKHRLGQILMGVSYEMSKREGRLGGPEKPLSELGRRAYISYWSTTLARTILAFPMKRTLTVQHLRDVTFIVAEDIITTLQSMDVLEHKKRGGVEAVINKAKVREWAEKRKWRLDNPVDPNAFLIEEIEDRAQSEGQETDD